MHRVGREVKDRRVLTLIRRYLKAGLMVDGLHSPRTEGTPQGGPLSPTLSERSDKAGASTRFYRSPPATAIVLP